MNFDPNDDTDYRNQIRRCPHCDEIWIKTSGCNGVTTCGNRAWSAKESVDDFQECERNASSKYRWTFWLEGFILKWIKGEHKTEKQKVRAKSESKGKGLGCGREITWSRCPRVTVNELKQLLNTDSLEAIAAALAKKPKISTGLERIRSACDLRLKK